MKIIQELGKSYVVANSEKKSTEYYMVRMLSDNKIDGIPLCKIIESSSEFNLRFDVSNMKSLKREYEDKILHFEDLKRIIYGINTILSTGMEFLLDEQQYVFDPNYIFIDMLDDRINMIYIPETNIHVSREDTYHLLADFFLDKTDHKEEKAVSIAYQFYRMSKETLFSLSDFCTLIDREECKKTSRASYESSFASLDITNNGYESETEQNKYIEENELFVSAKEKNSESVNYVKTSVISGVVMILSILLYILIGRKSIYHIQFLSAAVIICIISSFFVIKSIVNILSRKKEIELEKDMSGKKVTVNEYWSDDQETEFFDDSTEVFDAKESKTLSLLWIENGEEKSETIYGTSVVLGKKFNEVDVCISDPTVSRKHAKVTVKGNNIFLQDLGSTNGTYIEGIKLSPGEDKKILNNQDFFLGKVQAKVV